jgi:hypothetical protein
MKALLLFLLTALIPLHSQGATHLLSFKTVAHQEAELLGDVKDDDEYVVENPVLKVKGKTYRLANSPSTPALNDLICRKIGSKARYSYVKVKKRGNSEAVFEADRNFGLKQTKKAKTVVYAFHCAEEE